MMDVLIGLASGASAVVYWRLYAIARRRQWVWARTMAVLALMMGAMSVGQLAVAFRWLSRAQILPVLKPVFLVAMVAWVLVLAIDLARRPCGRTGSEGR